MCTRQFKKKGNDRLVSYRIVTNVCMHIGTNCRQICFMMLKQSTRLNIHTFEPKLTLFCCVMMFGKYINSLGMHTVFQNKAQSFYNTINKNLNKQLMNAWFWTNILSMLTLMYFVLAWNSKRVFFTATPTCFVCEQGGSQGNCLLDSITALYCLWNIQSTLSHDNCELVLSC